MTIFSMFFIELMASRFDIFGEHDHDHDVEAVDPSVDIVRNHPGHTHNHEDVSESSKLSFIFFLHCNHNSSRQSIRKLQRPYPAWKICPGRNLGLATHIRTN